MAWREDVHINKLRLGPTGLVQNVQTEVISVAKILKLSDNNKKFILSGAVGAGVTLPAPKNGLRFGFITGLAFATTNWVIATSGAVAIIQGSLIVAGAAVIAANEKQINVVATAETLGDSFELVSDGTSWFVSGVGALAGSITATAPA